MEITEATWATEKIKPKLVIPCYFNTISILNANPERFKGKATLFS